MVRFSKILMKSPIKLHKAVFEDFENFWKLLRISVGVVRFDPEYPNCSPLDCRWNPLEGSPPPKNNSVTYWRGGWSQLLSTRTFFGVIQKSIEQSLTKPMWSVKCIGIRLQAKINNDLIKTWEVNKDIIHNIWMNIPNEKCFLRNWTRDKNFLLNLTINLSFSQNQDFSTRITIFHNFWCC